MAIDPVSAAIQTVTGIGGTIWDKASLAKQRKNQSIIDAWTAKQGIKIAANQTPAKKDNTTTYIAIIAMVLLISIILYFTFKNK